MVLTANSEAAQNVCIKVLDRFGFAELFVFTGPRLFHKYLRLFLSGSNKLHATVKWFGEWF